MALRVSTRVSWYQEVPAEHRTGPRSEVSARNESRQRSDVAHRHEDQELSIPGCVT